MRYRLRTLLIVLALGPVVIALAWWGCDSWRMHQEWEREFWGRFGEPAPATSNRP